MFEEEKDDVGSEIESVVEEKKENLETESESESIKDSDDDDEYNEEEEEDDEASDNELPVSQKQPSAFLEPEDDDDDDDNDDEYLQKFDESIKQKIIADYHPELKTHNYDEIEVLSRVVRDNNGTIIDPLHKTLPFITKYEKARVLGERATQLNSGAQPFVEVDADIIDGYVIALKEFDNKKIPFILKRPLPNGAVEYWKLEDLEFI
jgi:DNA-directed RNA polymerase I, II, and III subunit RPABC2